jgi:hypothetical protein
VVDCASRSYGHEPTICSVAERSSSAEAKPEVGPRPPIIRKKAKAAAA